MLKQNTYRHILASILSISTLSAHAASIGLGATWTDSPYKGYGGQYEPLPQIDIDNGRFYIDNTSIGAYLYKQNNQEITAEINYLPLEFNPKDTNNQKLKKLDKRHPTALAQLGYSITTSAGNISASIGGDILNNSNSILLDANYNLAFSGKKWSILQTIGLGWANSNHNNYYYGISHQEAKQSDLPYYHPKASFTPYASLTGSYTITKHINSFIGVRIEKLTGDTQNSPMIENSLIPSVFTGINYNF